MADIIPSIIAVGIFIFYIYIGYKNINRKITCLEHKLIIVANSVVIAIFLKDGLKNIFGRYWAETFYCNNMSLLRNNAYGFQWLQNANNSSFPSGHTTLIFAFIISLNHFFPKLKSLWVTTAVVVCVGQIGMYYHYVSDVLTGAILGSLSAWLSIRISQQNYEQKNNLMM